ncbi:sensor histidine kinase [Pseudosulfitobacter sp. DSM 107133]|uniref:sensor histidine kinase n=1 Tax=Pseudosulfitobacter sp. DSM 107133 TaxID=2883100 RepID=UPI000DF38E3A|nr:sensor histidine kinase [Pseudosulfitobacter sp. DSM 107133]UOA25417.1 putative sensor histidine kinase pdtaS [Pseudosulfitobacter sp. DSM 107133]
MANPGRARSSTWTFSRGLRFWVAAFLALALLPIGAMGVLQTRDLSREVDNRSELALLALTNTAAVSERQVFERAFGAAQALTAVLQLMLVEPERCGDYLSQYIKETGAYSFVGFLDPGGTMVCSSGGSNTDLSSWSDLTQQFATPRMWIDPTHNSDTGSGAAIDVLFPSYQDDTFRGYIAMSLPRSELGVPWLPSNTRRPLSLTTYNERGDILTTVSSTADQTIYVPQNFKFEALNGNWTQTFIAHNQFDQEQAFAVVPVVPGLVYALAAWPVEYRRPAIGWFSSAPLLFPLLMFVASLAVAYYAVDRLVVRHVKNLRNKVQAFSRTRRLPSASDQFSLSAELQDLEDALAEMAFHLLDDEAQMEDALREKNVLLKEIHHRVRNNLQLISSIMNMQIRKATEPETRDILRRLQERVMSLSSVHKSLYQTENLSRTNAGALLPDLFERLVLSNNISGLDYKHDFDEVVLFPDQAVPLTLLASELGTNALKFIGAEDGQRPYLFVSLKQLDGGSARLICENSIGANFKDIEPNEAGLGAQLIRAFATQLNGKIETTSTDHLYRTEVTFDVEDVFHEPADH